MRALVESMDSGTGPRLSRRTDRECARNLNIALAQLESAVSVTHETRPTCGCCSAPPPASARPTPCSKKAAGCRDEGKDVVVAVVETHGRAATAAHARGPRGRAAASLVQHRGVELTEMDLAAVLARQPEIALVDELAHTNAPGSRQRQALAGRARRCSTPGIDVISTVNIQHIESLNDVVQQITGVPQRETLPDAVLRARRPDRGRRPGPAGAARPARRGQRLPGGAHRRGAVELLPARQPDGAARAGPALAGRRGRQRAARRYRAEHGITQQVGGPGTRRRRADRRPGGRDPASAAAPASPPARPAASCSPCT